MRKPFWAPPMLQFRRRYLYRNVVWFDRRGKGLVIEIFRRWWIKMETGKRADWTKR